MMGAGSSIGAGIRKMKEVVSAASVCSVKVKGIGSVDGVGTTKRSVVVAEDTSETSKAQALKATSELNDAIVDPKKARRQISENSKVYLEQTCLCFFSLFVYRQGGSV